jgi:histidine triad (HIT) family protein
MEKDCLFCKIINGEIPCYKIYEDEDFLAFLDIHPVNLGHTLIVPKTHFVNIFDAPTESLEKIGLIVKKVAEAVKVGTGAEGVNLMMNNNKEAGQLIFHAHLHVIPRFAGDGLTHWSSQTSYQEADFKQIQERISRSVI